MEDAYIQIFYHVCIDLAPLILPVFAVYLIVRLTSDLLFKD